MADLKAVYTAPTEEIALENLEDFGEKWNSKHPQIYKSWSERCLLILNIQNRLENLFIQQMPSKDSIASCGK